MKVTKFVNLVAVGLTLTFAVGCKKKPVGVTQLPNGAVVGNGTNDQSGTMGNPSGTEGTPSGIASNPSDSHAGWHEDTQSLANETVHFDYDSSAVKASEESKLSAVEDYLKSHGD